jgi:nucleoside 2-deoxyribosyltransferase
VTPDQLRRRASLLEQSDAALDRFPDRLGTEFVREMTVVAEGLAALADVADRDGADALERARTWRHLGNAHFHLGNGYNMPELERSAAAFERAEALLRAVPDPLETLKVNYGLGKTLLQMSRARDPRIAAKARDRLVTALELAPEHLPAALPYLKESLADAERVVSLLTDAEGLKQEIDRLEQDVKRVEPPAPSLDAADIQTLFGVLQQEFEKDKQTLEPTRREGLESFMERLGELVDAGTAGGSRSLEEMIAGAGALGSMVRELEAQGRRPSLTGPGPTPGSRTERLLAALQDLKMFVFSAHGLPGAPPGMRGAALALFPRIARLTTWISEAGEDRRKVRQLELDQARGLANEVRRFARQAHVMLARPVWPPYRGLVEANRIFFSGPASRRAAMAAAAASLDLELDRPDRAGADIAEQRWHDLRAANVAVFDLSAADSAMVDPQVYYELGIALAIGTPLLLLAKSGTRIPFDVAQHVREYEPGEDMTGLLADAIDDAIYGMPTSGGIGSSLEATLGYAQRLADADRGNALLHLAVQTLQRAYPDPVPFHDALTACVNHLKGGHEVLLPRWPGSYPDHTQPRVFAVMPFREASEPAYELVAAAARKAGVAPLRGDLAEGQQIIASIWAELCRATHVTIDLSGFNPNVCLELGLAHTLGRPTLLIGSEGTAASLAGRLPGAAKWRCHTYSAEKKPKAEFRATLAKFFARDAPA